MAIYLIDFENVHDSGINGVTYLTEKDEVCIFYSVKSEHMSFDTHVNIMKTAARVKYIKLRRSAKNYLDFQLVTHLGYLIGARLDGPYFIISKDTGYDSVIDYWKDHGVTVTRQPSIGYNHHPAKLTGQNPSPVTPPAKVTVQQNNQISTQLSVPEITALAQTAKELPAVAPAKPVSENMESNGPKEDFAASLTEDSGTDAAETAAPVSKDNPESSQSKKSSRSSGKSRSRRNSKPQTISADPETPAESPDSSAESKASESPVFEDAEQDPAIEAEEQYIMKPDTLPESYRKKVRTALKGKEIPSAHYASIYKAILNSYDKLALNNLMVKTFGSSKGGVVYNLIKDIFTDFHSA